MTDAADAMFRDAIVEQMRRDWPDHLLCDETVWHRLSGDPRVVEYTTAADRSANHRRFLLADEPEHAYRLGTRRNPGRPGGQQGQTYYRAECTGCGSHGHWRIDYEAAEADMLVHVSGRRWPARRPR